MHKINQNSCQTCIQPFLVDSLTEISTVFYQLIKKKQLIQIKSINTNKNNYIVANE